MYSSQLDGASLFSGGGFMPSQATQSNDHSFSPAKPNRANQCLLSVTVKQISDACQSSDERSNFIIDGVDVNNVKLVGIVTNMVEKVTDVNFSLDDGTGRINTHRWVNDASESNEMANIRNGMYVQVNGQLKGFQGNKQIVAFSVRPVSDFNEIAHHFIECIYIHLYNVKLQNSGDGQPQTSSKVTAPFQNGSLGHQAAVPNNLSGHVIDAGSDFDKMVLAVFHEPQNLENESGVHVDQIAKQLGVPRDKVMDSINYHTDNGNIYSTIDEYHYKSTING